MKPLKHVKKKRIRKMKIRNGFVSNSSSSSFTIYGWSEEVLSKHVGENMPIGLDFLKLDIDEDLFTEKLEELWPGENTWDITSCRDSNGYNVFGIGSAGDEVDHYVDNFSNDFRYDEPNDDKKKQLDEIAEVLNLPAPKIYQETFYA